MCEITPVTDNMNESLCAEIAHSVPVFSVHVSILYGNLCCLSACLMDMRLLT